MEKSRIYDSVKSMWQNKLGMKKQIVKHLNYESECFVLNGEYYRLDSFPSSSDTNDTLYCVEWAENSEEATYNHFEDAWIYPESLGIDAILKKMESDILSA